MSVASDSDSVGERIRIAREANDLTQTRLGELIGVKQQSVQKWESGGMPSTRNLEKLSLVLGVPIAALLGNVNEVYIPGPADKPADEIEVSASGVDLEELRQLDPEQYDAIMRQAELALDRARRRRLER